MKIFDILQSDVTKIKNWFVSKEPELVVAIQDGLRLTTSALAWRNSPAGLTAAEFVEAHLPKSATWIAEGTKIAEALIADMGVCQNPASWKGIALRLGGEIAALIHGKKLPTGIDGYIQEVQNVFVG